jgi:drug/metabolite transporter (DMT)-like permease
MRSSGILICLAAGAAAGAMAAFGKLAYDEGVTVGTLLAVRFALAAVLFWLLLAARGRLGEVRAMERRDVAIALALGFVGYAAQAGCYFGSLGRIDASLLSLVLYTFPAIVAVGAVLLGRERLTRRKLQALTLSSGGLVLVVAGAGIGSVDALGVALAFGAALVYSTYILVSDGVSRRVRPQVLAALVCTGAAVTLTVASALLGELRLSVVTPAGWGWLVCLVVVSTVGAITLFFAGLARVGPTSASILSTVEPVITVALAMAIFGESLGAVQALGGLLVIAAVPVLARRQTSSKVRSTCERSIPSTQAAISPR